MIRQVGVRPGTVVRVALLLMVGAARAETGAEAVVAWPPVFFGPYVGTGPWPSCVPWGCVDPAQVRRELRRELRDEALRRELDPRGAEGSAGRLYTYPSTGDLPPPTPASQIRPRYRESGTVRPEYQQH